MAFPFLALGLSLAGVGAAGSFVSSALARQRIERERRAILQAEDERQRNLTAQADVQQRESELPFEEAEERTQREETNILRQTRAATPAVGAPPPNIAPAGSPMVVAAGEAEGGRERAFTDRLGAAMARLRGFNQFQFEADRERLRPAERLAQLSRTMQRSSEIVPLELQGANEKGQGLMDLASLFDLTGDVGRGLSLVPLLSGPGGLPNIARTASIIRPFAGGGPPSTASLFSPHASPFGASPLDPGFVQRIALRQGRI